MKWPKDKQYYAYKKTTNKEIIYSEINSKLYCLSLKDIIVLTKLRMLDYRDIISYHYASPALLKLLYPRSFGNPKIISYILEKRRIHLLKELLRAGWPIPEGLTENFIEKNKATESAKKILRVLLWYNKLDITGIPEKDIKRWKLK